MKGAYLFESWQPPMAGWFCIAGFLELNHQFWDAGKKFRSTPPFPPHNDYSNDQWMEIDLENGFEVSLEFKPTVFGVHVAHCLVW